MAIFLLPISYTRSVLHVVAVVVQFSSFFNSYIISFCLIITIISFIVNAIAIATAAAAAALLFSQFDFHTMKLFLIAFIAI